MAARKLICVLFGILAISAWVLGSAIQVGAETLKCRNTTTVTKSEELPVSDEEGHILGVSISEGLAFCDTGEIVKMRTHRAYDVMPGGVTQMISYNVYTFEDGSAFVTRSQRFIAPDGSAKTTGEIIKGTGRFEGIKGSGSATGKTFPPGKGEALRVFNDSTFTYTLPNK